MVSSPRSSASDGLVEEIIAGELHGVLVLVQDGRGRIDDELRREDLVPGQWPGTDQDAIAGPLQDDLATQAEHFGPCGGELDAVAGFEGRRLGRIHGALLLEQ